PRGAYQGDPETPGDQRRQSCDRAPSICWRHDPQVVPGRYVRAAGGNQTRKSRVEMAWNRSLVLLKKLLLIGVSVSVERTIEMLVRPACGDAPARSALKEPELD